MTSRMIAGMSVLAFALAGCAGAREAIRARPGPASTSFDPRELVDVLGRDVVPAIDRPSFEAQSAAAEKLGGSDPVVVLVANEEARAYPLAILIWHEIVNDSIAGEPVAVTYAPLANAAIVFRRTIGGRTVTFGGSGKLYRSNLVMYDRATSSLWAQLRGEAVSGPLAGTTLQRVPAQITSFADFRASYPAGTVLTAETGAARIYGANPYPRYDARAAPSDSFFALAPDRRYDAMERVLGVVVGAEARAYPYARLRAGVAHDRLGGIEIVLLWREGTRSALDAPLIADGRDVGSAGVFLPVIEGRRLTLTSAGEGFRDVETGSTWSVLGVATAGPLRGRRLTPVPAIDTFWFAWAAFVPSTSLFGGS